MKMDRVVFVTFDGVRRDEFFSGSPFGNCVEPALPYVWSELKTRSILFGTCVVNDPMWVSHPSYISLPCYQTIMTGAVQPAKDNNAGPVLTETVFERVIHELDLSQKQVGVFASWSKIKHAVGSADRMTVDTGPSQDETDLPPWKDCRWDRITMERAMSFLAKNDPTLLYISLTDTDDVSHTGNFQGYLDALRASDTFLAALVNDLERMRGKTLLLVTTDHGRGLGDDWADHHRGLPHCREIWALALGINVSLRKAMRNSEPYTHLDIRPTLEKALGLTPMKTPGGGKSLIATDINSDE